MLDPHYLQTSYDGNSECVINEEVIVRGSVNAIHSRHLYRRPEGNIIIRQKVVDDTPVILAVSSQRCDLLFVQLFGNTHQSIALPRPINCHVDPCDLSQRHLYFDFLVDTARYTTDRFTCYHRQNLNEICELLTWPRGEIPFIKISAHLYDQSQK